MAFITKIEIQGLFGLYDHPVVLRSDEPVTILAGPNGIGKTTLLGLTRDLCQGAYRNLLRHNYTRLRVESDAGEALVAEPRVTVGAGTDPEISLALVQGDRIVHRESIAVPQHLPEFELPPYVETVGRDLFLDRRVNEYLALEEVVARYGRRHSAGRRKDVGPAPPAWFNSDDWKVDFIETKRLDTLISRARTATRRGEPPAAPIDVYLGNVRTAMEDARRESTLARQRLDRTFVRRLLARAKETVNEGNLRARYSRVEASAEELRQKGLLSEALELLPSGKLTPTNKRIIDLFLDDFEAKLRPLEPVSGKLEQLRTIIDEKFVNKKIAFDPQEGVLFLAAPDGDAIAPDALSSGEQHALALMSRLLFTEQPGTTVLIDEPELSLHVSWQHDMVDDLWEIARVAGLRFLLATHSTAIINNRWEIVEELGAIDATRDG